LDISTHWERKREPDAVPTPIAIALSDFCRRAQSPAAPGEVRDALALLTEDDDFRVRALAESDPQASPLGPFAVNDVLAGTLPAVAAQRQSLGYYELAAALVDERARKAPPALPVAPAPSFAASVEARLDPVPERAERRAKEKAQSISEKIAPRKRTPAQPMEAVSEEEDFPRRELPKGRGRFTRLAAQRAPAEELLGPAGTALAALLEQHPHRFALLTVLGEQFQSRGQEDLSLPDLEAALRQHGLLEQLEKQERELLLGSFTDHRGATSKVAWALNLRPADLSKLLALLGLRGEVDTVRERFQREALAPRNLSARLDLLGRTRYLTDLGIEKKFREALTRDLKELLGRYTGEAHSLDELAEHVSRQQGAPRELVLRAIDKLGLTETFRERLGDTAAGPT
jgi:hypothetical protein